MLSRAVLIRSNEMFQNPGLLGARLCSKSYASVATATPSSYRRKTPEAEPAAVRIVICTPISVALTACS